MSANHPIQPTHGGRKLLSGLLLSGLLIGMMTAPIQAESLFRASASTQQQVDYTPNSLFTRPSPQHVGDLITINIKEQGVLKSSAELKINREQTINENGSGLFNNMVGFVLDKLPFGSGLADTLSVPSLNGLNNSNELGSKAESTRSTTMNDIITCQIVQVLPNGHLVVQGQKTVAINKERQDIMVTGIVNPYYLNRRNEIDSNMVANFQLLQGGHGVISRQQNDGIANKIYQFFN